MNMDACGIFGAVEDLGNFPAGKSFLHLEEHGGSLIGGQTLERVRQLACRLPLNRDQVGPSLHGRRFDPRVIGVVAGTSERKQPVPPFAPPLVVDAKVDQHAVKPGGKARAPVEPIGRLVKANEGILRDVASVGFVAEYRAGEGVGARLMAFDEQFKSLPVVLRDPCAQFLIRKLLQTVSPGGRPVAPPGPAKLRARVPIDRPATDATFFRPLDGMGGNSVYPHSFGLFRRMPTNKAGPEPALIQRIEMEDNSCGSKSKQCLLKAPAGQTSAGPERSFGAVNEIDATFVQAPEGVYPDGDPVQIRLGAARNVRCRPRRSCARERTHGLYRIQSPRGRAAIRAQLLQRRSVQFALARAEDATGEPSGQSEQSGVAHDGGSCLRLGRPGSGRRRAALRRPPLVSVRQGKSRPGRTIDSIRSADSAPADDRRDRRRDFNRVAVAGFSTYLDALAASLHRTYRRPARQGPSGWSSAHSFSPGRSARLAIRNSRSSLAIPTHGFPIRR